MEKKLKLIPGGQLIEYNWDFYTPEELTEHFNLSGEYEVKIVDKETWFSAALEAMEQEKQ